MDMPAVPLLIDNCQPCDQSTRYPCVSTDPKHICTECGAAGVSAYCPRCGVAYPQTIVTLRSLEELAYGAAMSADEALLIIESLPDLVKVTSQTARAVLNIKYFWRRIPRSVSEEMCVSLASIVPNEVALSLVDKSFML